LYCSKGDEQLDTKLNLPINIILRYLPNREKNIMWRQYKSKKHFYTVIKGNANKKY